MEKFKIVKKGYDIIEVENFILDSNKQNEKVIAKLRETITKMKQEYDEQSIILQGYKTREDGVNKALTKAIESAKDIEYTAKVKFALESERLNDFSDKWTRFCNSACSSVDEKTKKDTINFIENTKNELKMIMNSQLNIEGFDEIKSEYIAEKRRIKAI